MSRESGAVRPVDLATNDASGLAAIAFREPRLSWRLETDCDGVVQFAYEIERSAEPGFAQPLSGGRMCSARPFGAPLPGPALESREVCWLRVRVWTNLGASDWSDPLRLEGSLYRQDDWMARPISPAFNAGLIEPAPVVSMRRSVTIDRRVQRARLYVSALGLQQIWINGRPVSDALLEPGWTAYGERLLYASHDITEFLVRGENVFAAEIADGWWRGHLTWLKHRAVYGDTTALLAQFEMTLQDGARLIVASDEDWRAAESNIALADIYDGCSLDQRTEQDDWRLPGFDDSNWQPVRALPLPAGLEQRSAPPVRVVDRFDAQVTRASPETSIIDCGQNLTGFLHISGRAAREGEVVVRHAEIIEPDGSLHTAALRGAKAMDVYQVPEGAFALEPRFTYHGFRHAEIAASRGIEVDRVFACVAASDLPEIGHFACSDERVNTLWRNTVWSQRGNFVSIPTDCPQRDERLGWTGDIQVFAPTACANFDARAFLSGWLVDLAHEQAADGQVPSTVPNVIGFHDYEYGGVGWADAATLVPWAVYEAYGDETTLARQFPSMRSWVDWGLSRLDADGVWTGDFHLGDWLDPGAPPERPEEATTPRDFIASAYLAQSARIVAKAARIVRMAELSMRYAEAADAVARATWARWRDQALTTQTGCAMAIEFGIARGYDLRDAGEALARLVKAAEGRIATGFLGTPLVLPALTRTGHVDAAYRLLLNEQAPGWLYQVKKGATTIWERWDAIRPDGTIHGGEMAAEDADSMLSFNHYAYGSVGAWLYRALAGIAPRSDVPGYGLIDFAPEPGGGIGWAEATIQSPYGEAGIRWDLHGDELTVALRIPPGARGEFTEPRGWMLDRSLQPEPLGSGRHQLRLLRCG